MKTYWKPVALVAAIMALAIIISDSYYQWIRHVFKGSSEVEDTNQNGIPDDQESGVTAVDSRNAVNTNLPASIGEARGIPYTIYEVDPTKGLKTVHAPTGSIIDIPPDAFLNPDGSRAQEKVKIYYREFHSYYDAVISGVPMDYEENGKKYALETSGMLEIQAYSGQGLLNINSNAPVRVNVKTKKPEAKANLYSMPYDEAFWLMDGISGVVKISDTTLLQSKPQRPVLFDEIGFNVEDVDGIGEGLEEYEDCYFMPQDGKKHGSSCNHIEVKDAGNGSFIVNFEHRVEGQAIWKDQCSCDLVVPAGYHHSAIDACMAKYGGAVKSYDAMLRQDRINLQNYEDAMDSWRTEIQEAYYRPIKVLQTGYYNCDTPFPYVAEFNGDFQASFVNELNKPIQVESVRRLEENRDVGFTYFGTNISYDEKQRFALILSITDKEVTYVPVSETKQIKGSGNSYVLKVRREKVTDAASLKKLLFST